MHLGNFSSLREISIHSQLILICGQVDTKHVLPNEDECSVRFSVSSD